MRLVLRLLAVLVAAGCTSHSDAGSTAASWHQPTTHTGGGGGLADWNSSVNTPPAGLRPAT